MKNDCRVPIPNFTARGIAVDMNCPNGRAIGRFSEVYELHIEWVLFCKCVHPGPVVINIMIVFEPLLKPDILVAGKGVL